MSKEENRIRLEGSGTRWSNKVKFRRGAWLLLQPFFRLSTKRHGNKFRICLINLFGGQVATNAWIFPSVKITDPLNLEVGEWSVIGPSVEIYNLGKIVIGSQTVVSQRVYLCTASHDYTNVRFPLLWKPIFIGRDAWLAEGVMVMPGVTIGEGTVIGARSLVTKDMPAWTVCAGHPCKPLKPRVLRS